jgi:hypothetical protein
LEFQSFVVASANKPAAPVDLDPHWAAGKANTAVGNRFDVELDHGPPELCNELRFKRKNAAILPSYRNAHRGTDYKNRRHKSRVNLKRLTA